MLLQYCNVTPRSTMTMHRAISRQGSLVCALLCVLRLVAADRGDAFIGYKEKEDLCIDTNDNCEKWSKGVLSQCIENAYYMRQFCRKVSPLSALLRPVHLRSTYT